MRRWMKFVLIALLILQTGCGGGNGDRVLVNKYAYNEAFGTPSRHDVVVFRYPENPLKGGAPTNYIKRLIGLAGETIAIFFGQLFYTTALSYPEDRKTADPLELWQQQFMHIDAEDAQKLFREGKFQIIRKSPKVMLAMRRIVYDNDFPAKDLQGVLPPRWDPLPDSQWKTEEENGFVIQSTNKDIDWLHYQNIVRPDDWPDANHPNSQFKINEIKARKHEPKLITDFLAYNSRDLPGLLHNDTHHWVGDLMLDFELKVDKEAGEFWMELAKGPDRFRARFDLQTGLCTLFRLNDEQTGEVKLDEKSTSVKGPGTYQIKFANFDERLTLWVGSNLPFGDGKTYDRAWKFEFDKTALDADGGAWVGTGPTVHDLKPASLGSKQAEVHVHHLKLWRDTYYTTTKYHARSDIRNYDQLPLDVWTNPEEFGPLRQLGLRTMYVQPGHYLCMGDNSPESSDSRAWGTVPERLLLGRALVVYYPFNRVSIIH